MKKYQFFDDNDQESEPTITDFPEDELPEIKKKEPKWKKKLGKYDDKPIKIKEPTKLGIINEAITDSLNAQDAIDKNDFPLRFKYKVQKLTNKLQKVLFKEYKRGERRIRKGKNYSINELSDRLNNINI